MIQRISVFFLVMLTPIFLLAHGSHGSGVMAGFTHPIFGTDHLIAILGVGILGYVISSKRWYLPLLGFLIAMIGGGYLRIGNEATFLIEKIIAFSVFFIGLLIALGFKINIGLVIGIAAAFGFVHGYAHGAEMPESNTAVKYVSGYTLGALLVGAVGMLIGRLVGSQAKGEEYVKILDGVLCGCGIMILIS